MEGRQCLLPRRRLVSSALQYRRRASRHLALRYGSRIHPIGFKIADKRSEDGVYIDVKQGGTLIEYADEDPYVRKHYNDELRKTGLERRCRRLDNCSKRSNSSIRSNRR